MTTTIISMQSAWNELQSVPSYVERDSRSMKSIALEHAKKALKNRLSYRSSIRSNSFESWGNEKCIARLMDTIAAMEGGYASERQYRYWYCH